jgi:hypothetical protein
VGMRDGKHPRYMPTTSVGRAPFELKFTINRISQTAAILATPCKRHRRNGLSAAEGFSCWTPAFRVLGFITGNSITTRCRMKSHFLVILTILALSFAASPAAAQRTYTGVGTNGMFGYRVVGGAPIGVSTSSMFGNRYIGPSLNSLTIGGMNGPGTYFNSRLTAPYSTSLVPQINTVPLTPETAMLDVNNLAAPPVVPEAASLPYPVPNQPTGMEGIAPQEQGMAPAAQGMAPAAQGMAPVQQGAAMPAGMGTSAIPVPTIPFPRGWNFATPASAAPLSSFTRSAALSERMTQIARDRGMLAGRGIEVSMHGDIAVMLGKVHTSAESATLANVLSLEPQVRRIDNRLATEENTANSSNLRSR